MRSYRLIQIAEAFAASDPAKARGLLQDAFSASLTLRTIFSPRKIAIGDISPASSNLLV